MSNLKNKAPSKKQNIAPEQVIKVINALRIELVAMRAALNAANRANAEHLRWEATLTQILVERGGLTDSDVARLEGKTPKN